MDSDTQSNQSQLSTDYSTLYDSLHRTNMEAIAIKYYNEKQDFGKIIPQSTRDIYDLLLKHSMQTFFGNEIYEYVLATHENGVQSSDNLPQNDNVQIHVTI